MTNGARVGAQTLGTGALAYCPPSPGCGRAQGRCLLSSPQSAARAGSAGGTQGPLWKGPTPFEALSPPFYGMHAGRLIREAAPLCTHVERAPGYIFKSKKSSYRTVCEV